MSFLYLYMYKNNWFNFFNRIKRSKFICKNNFVLFEIYLKNITFPTILACLKIDFDFLQVEKKKDSISNVLSNVYVKEIMTKRFLLFRIISLWSLNYFRVAGKLFGNIHLYSSLFLTWNSRLCSNWTNPEYLFQRKQSISLIAKWKKEITEFYTSYINLKEFTWKFCKDHFSQVHSPSPNLHYKYKKRQKISFHERSYFLQSFIQKRMGKMTKVD